MTALTRPDAVAPALASWPRLLVIDDEPRILSFVARGLAASGYRVEVASDPVRGLEMARGGAYDLVILDLLMPGLDGRELLSRLMAERPGQPVVVLSALADVGARVESLRLGAEDHLAKPFAFEELLARVEARLRAARSRRILQVGGVLLDLVAHEAVAGGAAVPLSGREFLLMRELMTHPGEVVSKEALLERVWGLGFDPGTNVVDVCVSRLRARLGAGVIRTVRGRGYVVSGR